MAKGTKVTDAANAFLRGGRTPRADADDGTLSNAELNDYIRRRGQPAPTKAETDRAEREAERARLERIEFDIARSDVAAERARWIRSHGPDAA